MDSSDLQPLLLLLHAFSDLLLGTIVIKCLIRAHLIGLESNVGPSPFGRHITTHHDGVTFWMKRRKRRKRSHQERAEISILSLSWIIIIDHSSSLDQSTTTTLTLAERLLKTLLIQDGEPFRPGVGGIIKTVHCEGQTTDRGRALIGESALSLNHTGAITLSPALEVLIDTPVIT